MERYRKLKVIGKGSFGYAVLVQSVADRQSYVMKASTILCPFNFRFRLLMYRRWTENSEKMQSTR
jgi:hypothetical protein